MLTSAKATERIHQFTGRMHARVAGRICFAFSETPSDQLANELTFTTDGNAALMRRVT